MDILYGPIFELAFSILIAIVIGYIFKQVIYKLRYDDFDKDLVVFVTLLVAILISIAIANRGFYLFGIHVHLSPILLPMGVGIVFANLSTDLAKHETERMLDQFSPPILILFFTVVGAEMVLMIYLQTSASTLTRLLFYGGVYVVFRVVGKILGSYLGGLMAGSKRHVRRYLGFCLLPQAQAAIALAFYERSQLTNPADGNLLIVVTILGTLVYELLGPFGLRHSLLRCHEVDEHGACVISPKYKHYSSGSNPD